MLVTICTCLTRLLKEKKDLREKCLKRSLSMLPRVETMSEEDENDTSEVTQPSSSPPPV